VLRGRKGTGVSFDEVVLLVLEVDDVSCQWLPWWLQGGTLLPFGFFLTPTTLALLLGLLLLLLDSLSLQQLLLLRVCIQGEVPLR
jgi:hypothetical protein